MMANKISFLSSKTKLGKVKASTVALCYFISFCKDPLNIHAFPFVKNKNCVKFITFTFSNSHILIRSYLKVFIRSKWVMERKIK